MNDWKSQLKVEMERAESARSKGNEGQTRVCARRAAGIAIREFYARRGDIVHTPSALTLLDKLAVEPNLSPELTQSINYLVLRVDKEFKLPAGIDLLDEVRNLCNALLHFDPAEL